MTPTVNLKATPPSHTLDLNRQTANQDRVIPLICPYALCQHQHQHQPDLPRTRQSPLIHSSKTYLLALYSPAQPPPTQPNHTTSPKCSAHETANPRPPTRAAHNPPAEAAAAEEAAEEAEAAPAPPLPTRPAPSPQPHKYIPAPPSRSY